MFDLCDIVKLISWLGLSIQYKGVARGLAQRARPPNRNVVSDF